MLLLLGIARSLECSASKALQQLHPYSITSGLSQFMYYTAGCQRETYLVERGSQIAEGLGSVAPFLSFELEFEVDAMRLRSALHEGVVAQPPIRFHLLQKQQSRETLRGHFHCEQRAQFRLMAVTMTMCG